jgi:serine/threonine protein kinase
MQPRAFEPAADSGGIPSPPSPVSIPGGAAADGGGLRLLESLGAGGSAHVWRASDSSGRCIALKVLKPELRQHPAAAALLRDEYEVLVTVRHPRIVTALGFGDYDGIPALALEYLGGGDLVPLLGSHPRHWIRAAFDVRAALAHVHACGFVHRDLSARNVLFDSQDRATLIDFASARPIGSVAGVGGTTAAYRAGQDGTVRVTPDADCFAFAVLLHELLTGRLPGGDARGTGTPGSLSWWGAGAAEPVALALLKVANTAIADRGGSPGGLSAFADVIESALEVYR